MRALIYFVLLASMLACGTPEETPVRTAVAPSERAYWFDGATPAARIGDGFVFRRNNASLVAWAEVLASSPAGSVPAPTATRPRRILVHLDAHSDAHPSRTAPDSAAFAGFQRPAVEGYAESLPVSSFVLPALYYGWIDEVYWIQPPIQAFRGPVESYVFDLEEIDGWIRPQVKPDRADPGETYWTDLSRRLLDGAAVGRSFELDFAYRAPMRDWCGDRFRFHLLDAAQFDSLLHVPDLREAQWILDLDLDYFGAMGPLRGYGLLEAISPVGFAQGTRGHILPVFELDPQARAQGLDRVASWMRRLDVIAWSISESPDHAFLDSLPRLEAEAKAACSHFGVHRGAVPSLRVALITGRDPDRVHFLDPACESWVDLEGADSLALHVEWEGSFDESLEVSIYFDPVGARDRLAARWRVSSSDLPEVLGAPLPVGDHPELLGTGWEVEVRRGSDAALWYAAAFCLDQQGALAGRRMARKAHGRFEPTLGDRALSGDRAAPGVSERDAAMLLRDLEVHAFVRLARKEGWDAAELHEALLAHPRTYETQCEFLARARAIR